MEISIAERGVTVDMTFYTKKILEEEDVVEMKSPCPRTMFIVESSVNLLDEETRKWFHTKTAKLLYLAKRARPDILTAVSFLCTRVQSATTEDAVKLARVLGYIKSTVDQVLYIRTAVKPVVRAYIDAAYALHSDSKSHTGVIIFVGHAIAYVSSKKQKCMSKSPTEARS
jgi:hypothetical protein